ncbi:MAG: 1-deoxy-D-xylulose-5-phosphate reductoisomerase [Bacteroidetes Order II. Incertae sedis bacterium]|nr:1-deoxy-D-xylulose-5-phosphate reductoisomerase [Bacteroidetes Order II. bacterium]
MLPNHTFYTSHESEPLRNLVVLGSTGSIGTQTLEIACLFPENIRIVALTAGKNADLLIRQAQQFKPKLVVIGDETQYAYVREALHGTPTRVATGAEGIEEAAIHPDANLVVAAMVGYAGLAPTIAAMKAGKDIALANKETLVVAGKLIAELARQTGTAVLPVDSEHSAIFQCLLGEPEKAVETLILTASGGPFRTRSASDFATITKAEALKHPNWDMGAKITIDSATMMNKGLEVIEARWLFDIEPEKIQVVVHPQSIIHSMVLFCDGSTKAQLGVPDMKVPIQYALTYPRRWAAPHERLNWSQIRSLEFETPDFDKFPSLRLAFESLDRGGVAPAVLNAANEVAVGLFLQETIRFADIPALVEKALGRIQHEGGIDLDVLRSVDSETRRFVGELV